MSKFKNVLFVFSLSLAVAAGLNDKVDAAELIAPVNGMAASKHYDPQHIGHFHKCKNCGQKYHQQGDEGQYSAGSNICSSCGFANPMPPSYGQNVPQQSQPPVVVYPGPQPPVVYPNQPQPPVVIYPDQPQFPQQPFPPITDNDISANPADMQRVDELIRAAEAEPNKDAADRILLAGAADLISIKGLCRLAIYIESDKIFIEFLRNFTRPNLKSEMNSRDLIAFMHKFESEKRMNKFALEVGKSLRSVKDIMSIAVNMTYADMSMKLLEYMDENFGRYEDAPSCQDVLFFWKKTGNNFEIGDSILIYGARYMTNPSDIETLAKKAQYQEVIDAIRELINGPYYRPVNNINSMTYRRENISRNSRVKVDEYIHNADQKAHVIKSAITKLKKRYMTDIDFKDIRDLNMEKIEVFVNKLNSGAYARSRRLFCLKQSLSERLREVSMNDPRASEFLEKIK